MPKMTETQARVAIMLGTLEAFSALKRLGFGKNGVVAIGKVLASLPVEGFKGNLGADKALSELLDKLSKEMVDLNIDLPQLEVTQSDGSW